MKSHLCIPFLGIARPHAVTISTFMCLRVIYIFPRIGPHFSCSRIGRSIVGIYKSLTDTCMWKLGLWPSNSFSGNMCIEFSVSCNSRTWSQPWACLQDPQPLDPQPRIHERPPMIFPPHLELTLWSKIIYFEFTKGVILFTGKYSSKSDKPVAGVLDEPL
jgi:hypothetical protein